MSEIEFSDDEITLLKKEYAMIDCHCCNRKVPGMLIYWPCQKKPERMPLWMPCKICGEFLSHMELDDPELKKACLECKKELEIYQDFIP